MSVFRRILPQDFLSSDLHKKCGEISREYIDVYLVVKPKIIHIWERNHADMSGSIFLTWITHFRFSILANKVQIGLKCLPVGVSEVLTLGDSDIPLVISSLSLLTPIPDLKISLVWRTLSTFIYFWVIFQPKADGRMEWGL